MRLATLFVILLVLFCESTHASFYFHTIGATSGGPDVTPDAVDWTDISRPDPCAPADEGNAQTITGIDTPIDLVIGNTGTTVQYQLDAGA